MDDKLRAALLAFPNMPRNEAGEPPGRTQSLNWVGIETT